MSDDNLFLSNVLPLSDQLGKNIEDKEVLEGIQEYLKFNIENTSNKEMFYEIFLTKQNISNSEISGNFVKLYLTDDSDVPFKDFSYNLIPSFDSLKSINDMPDARLLYSGSIYGKSSQNFILRMWISDSYGNLNSKEDFKVNIGIREKGE